MRKLARALSLTVLAMLALVPIQATPAAAFVGDLDVEPELVDRITGSIQRYTASVTPAAADLQISYIMGTPSGTIEPACKTVADGTCEFIVTLDTAGEADLLVFVEDGDTPLPCTRPSAGDPLSDCEGTEAQADEDENDTDVVVANFIDGVLDIEEEDKAFAPGGAVTFEATVLEKDPAEGEEARPLVANVDAEIEDGPNKNQKAAGADMECDTALTTGKCNLTYTAGAGGGIDKIRGWVDLNDDKGASPVTGNETTGDGFEADKDEALADDDDDTTDVVQASISGGDVLVLSPQSSTKAIGSPSALTATFTANAVPTSGKKIAAQVLPGGAHPGQAATCTTAANGQCTLNYTGTTAGTDKVRATVDADGNGLPNEADATEDVGTAGGTLEPDATAVSQIIWTAPEPDDDKCDAAKQKVKKLKKKIKKAKKAFKKARASGDDDRIAKKKKKVKKLKKKIKRAKQRKRTACA